MDCIYEKCGLYDIEGEFCGLGCRSIKHSCWLAYKVDEAFYELRHLESALKQVEKHNKI